MKMRGKMNEFFGSALWLFDFSIDGSICQMLIHPYFTTDWAHPTDDFDQDLQPHSPHECKLYVQNIISLYSNGDLILYSYEKYTLDGAIQCSYFMH